MITGRVDDLRFLRLCLHMFLHERKLGISAGVSISDRCFAKGQLWQVFVGSKERWVHGYYQALLAQQTQVSAEANGIKNPTAVDDNNSTLDQQSCPHSNKSEKWRSQIEKVKGITSIEFYILYVILHC